MFCPRKSPLISIAILLALLVLPVTADATTVVTPCDRVATRLNVREHPSAADTVSIVGKLMKNETAELLEAVPYWYRIRLHNGVEGYVSKAWANTMTATPAVERIRMGAWNIKKLGHGNSKDYQATARVIESNFDILAVIEVMQKGGGHPGYDDLMQTLGANWSGVITATPRPDTTAGYAEFYAIIYRPALIRPCGGMSGLQYHVDNDGSASGTGDDYFSREPAFGCFEVLRSDGSVSVDFMVAAYHAMWGSGDPDDIGVEVGHIDEVFTAMAAARPGEGDLFILGDFNLVPSDLDPLTSAADRTTGTGSTLNLDGDRTANLYDHLLVHDETASSELIGDAQVIDVRHVASSNDVFYGSVSDHLPILIEVQSGGTDDD